MVASGVASKGLDFNDIQHVIIFSMPKEIEDYVHQIGRTGRSGKTGIATTFVNMNTPEQTLLDLKYLLMEAGQKCVLFHFVLIRDPLLSVWAVCPNERALIGLCDIGFRRSCSASTIRALRRGARSRAARCVVAWATGSRTARNWRTRSGGRWHLTAGTTGEEVTSPFRSLLYLRLFLLCTNSAFSIPEKRL